MNYKTNITSIELLGVNSLYKEFQYENYFQDMGLNEDEVSYDRFFIQSGYFTSEFDCNGYPFEFYHNGEQYFISHGKLTENHILIFSCDQRNEDGEILEDDILFRIDGPESIYKLEENSVFHTMKFEGE